MNEQQLWVPKAIETLPALLVRPNGKVGSFLMRDINKDRWQEKPATVLMYYRPATNAETQELLPEAA